MDLNHYDSNVYNSSFGSNWRMSKHRFLYIRFCILKHFLLFPKTKVRIKSTYVHMYVHVPSTLASPGGRQSSPSVHRHSFCSQPLAYLSCPRLRTDAGLPLLLLCHATTSPARPVVGTGQKPPALHRTRGLQLNVQWVYSSPLRVHVAFSTGKLGYSL